MGLLKRSPEYEKEMQRQRWCDDCSYDLYKEYQYLEGPREGWWSRLIRRIRNYRNTRPIGH